MSGGSASLLREAGPGPGTVTPLGPLIGLVLVPRVLLLMRHICEVIGHGGAGHSDLITSVIIKEQRWG